MYATTYSKTYQFAQDICNKCQLNDVSTKVETFLEPFCKKLSPKNKTLVLKFATSTLKGFLYAKEVAHEINQDKTKLNTSLNYMLIYFARQIESMCDENQGGK